MRLLQSLFFIAIGFFAISVAADPIRGDATFTEASKGGGTCSFANYTFPSDIYGTGLGPANWFNGSKCGSCLQVNGPRGSAKVMIVDSCPSCTGNRLNLFADAFNRVGNPNDGIISITYEPVSCSINRPLTVRNKEGSSRWFFSMQVLDCNHPVIGLDVSTDNGRSWQQTVRRDYNYFEKEKSGGFEKDSVMVKIACSNKNSVIIPDVSMAGEAKTVAPVNC